MAIEDLNVVLSYRNSLFDSRIHDEANKRLQELRDSGRYAEVECCSECCRREVLFPRCFIDGSAVRFEDGPLVDRGWINR